jgi:hypothetical protein
LEKETTVLNQSKLLSSTFLPSALLFSSHSAFYARPWNDEAHSIAWHSVDTIPRHCDVDLTMETHSSLSKAGWLMGLRLRGPMKPLDLCL